MKPVSRFLAAAVLIVSSSRTLADVIPNPLFTDNAVLQQGMSVPVWGTADPGERVTVEIAGQSASATADAKGRWMVRLAPLKAGGPFTMAISGKNKIAVNGVLVGEVWVCSGQSNMERHLGLQEGQKPIVNWEQEVRDAKYPQIRQFYVNKATAFDPQSTEKGAWSVCSPDTVKDFTAVGYFFGRDLYQARSVPIGLIHTSWGGTPAEAWTSEATLRTLPDFAGPLAQLKQMVADPAAAEREAQAKMDAWYAAKDPTAKANPPWSAAELDASSWQTMNLPAYWESAGYPDFDGIFWFRKTFTIPELASNAVVELHLGAVDDADTTWLNGVRVGGINAWDVSRVYTIPAGVALPGPNVVAVRVLDMGAGGGLWGGKDTMRIEVRNGDQTNTIPLSGEWRCKQGPALAKIGWPPTDYRQSPSAPTVLFNAMIAPLVPCAMRGVIWYQGEANVGRERQYRTLFPAMIADWRRVWGEGDFPFLFVQIAPYQGMTPEIREAQLLTWQRTTNTAMAVTIDCGDAEDIHPARKQPMGARLALAARALAYGEKIEYSGPEFASVKIKGSKAVLSFNHLGGGLKAQGGPLAGFTVAGADGVFHPAKAEIKGETVVVTAEAVKRPAAVRYGWANVPVGNLFNAAGLPASPFRTDVE